MKFWTQFSVKRPIGISMIFGVVLIFGYMSFKGVVIDLFPDITFPTVAIVTSYPGVGPEEVEELVTKPIENSVSRVENAKKVFSISQPGLSIVLIEFNWETNIDFASQDVRERLSLTEDILPDEVRTPSVLKMNMKNWPVIYLGIASTKRPIWELKELADNVVKPEIEKSEGVAAVEVIGGLTKRINVKVDTEKLISYGIPINNVFSALRSTNLDISGGFIESSKKEHLIRLKGKYRNLEDIIYTPIAYKGASVVYVKDVAEVEEGFADVRGKVRLQGKPSVAIVVYKQAVENSVRVVDNVKKRVKEIKEKIPKDINLVYSWDQASIIKMSINSLKNNGYWGMFFAFLIILFFLRSLRVTFIITLSIPISIIATFVLMYFAHISVNIMSLGGLTLAVGIIVDNSIIVLENIYRQFSLNKDIKEAAIIGTQEVTSAITASTVTNIAVFLPIVFITGIVGKLFKELAYTVIYSLTVSLFVAVTLTPMLFVLLFSKKKFVEKKAEDTWFLKVSLFLHDKILVWTLKHRLYTILIMLFLFVLSLGLINFIGKEFLPKTEGGDIMVKPVLEIGSVLSETDRFVKKFENKLLSLPEITSVFAGIGFVQEEKEGVAFGGGATDVNEAVIWAHLKTGSSKKGGKTKEEIKNELRKMAKNTNTIVMGGEEMILMGNVGKTIEITLSGNDRETLAQSILKMEKVLKTVKGVVNIETSLKKGKPEFSFYLQKKKAAELGFNLFDIANALEISSKGKVATQMEKNGKELDVFVRLKKEDRNNLERIKNILIASPFGLNTMLSEIVNVKSGVGPDKIERENNRRILTVGADTAKRDLGSILREIKEKFNKIKLPSSYLISYGGSAKQLEETFQKLSFAIIMAIILVFMAMAIQFESFIHPFTIMFCVPLAMIGALFALFITHTSLNVTSLIGLVTVIGICVNDAIVLISYTAQLRESGKKRFEALLEAGATRLRPVFLTSATTILGLFPTALGLGGEGAEMNKPLAVSIIGGLVASTFLTLIVIPVVYSLLDDVERKIFKIKKYADS